MQLIASRPEDYQGLKTGIWQGFRVPLGGLEPDETLDMLSGWSARLVTAQGWGTWLGVTADEVVASLAIKQPMQDGAVEIGYAVATSWRGCGIATSAVRLLLDILQGYGAVCVTAESAADNPASGRVLAANGFQQLGHRLDPEDGTLILWCHKLPPRADM